ncbi:MAG: hypothetical protein KAI88_02870 [Nitrosomonadaceae bacterium]|nr:hypothetical protein [Nitrosomonadaceae bacterium]
MAEGSRKISDVLTIMRAAIARRNANDPDSDESKLLSYVNDFISLSMPNESRLFSQFGTLPFTIDETATDGVYTFNDVGADTDFMSLSNEGFISLASPAGSSVSWNSIEIYRNPGEFYAIWGINNEDILIAGYPTQVLFYDNQLVFRTVPDTAYLVNLYGYKKINDYTSTNDDIPFDYWLRYIAYGAALNYVRDFNYSPEKVASVQRTFASERKLILMDTHNEIKHSRSLPRF